MLMNVLPYMIVHTENDVLTRIAIIGTTTVIEPN